MTQIPHKIVLKSTTKISLNDRFSSIQVVRPQNTPPVQQVRVNMAAVQQASARNRRLAQQMGNRPNVQAALRLKKKSLKQRLGTDVRSRLSLQGNGQPVVQRTPRGGRGVRARGRGLVRGVEFYGSAMSINSMTSNVSVRSRGGGNFRARGQAAAYQTRGRIAHQPRGRGMSPAMRRGTQGVRGYRGAVRGRGRVMRASTQWVRGARSRGAGGQGARGRGAGGRGGRRGMQGPRGQTRGRGRGRGARGGRGGNPNVTREQLDDQLEEYMCRTKGHLDSELDDYMIGGNM